MIGPVSYNYNFYPVNPASLTGTVNAVSSINKTASVKPQDRARVWESSPTECRTCNNRKYVDGSNDMNVSFKTPTNISPQASFSMVSAHESEHVANAISEGNRPGAKLLSVSIKLQMEVCPECGRPYISGGETRTTIQYQEPNPYESNRKSLEGSLLRGMNVDYVA